MKISKNASVVNIYFISFLKIFFNHMKLLNPFWLPSRKEEKREADFIYYKT